MAEQPNDDLPEDLPPGAYSLNVVHLIMEGPSETPPRPMTAEEIAAMKRFWERQGRKPPPPYDKL